MLRFSSGLAPLHSTSLALMDDHQCAPLFSEGPQALHLYFSKLKHGLLWLFRSHTWVKLYCTPAAGSTFVY